MYTATLQHKLKRSVEKFFAFIALHRITLSVEQYLFNPATTSRADFVPMGTTQARLLSTSIQVSRYHIPSLKGEKADKSARFIRYRSAMFFEYVLRRGN